MTWGCSPTRGSATSISKGYATDLDEDSDELLARIADRMKLGSQFRHAVSHPHR